MSNPETEPRLDNSRQFALACLEFETFLQQYQINDRPPETIGTTTSQTQMPFTSSMNLNPPKEQGGSLIFAPDSLQLFLSESQEQSGPKNQIVLTQKFGTQTGPAQTLNWVKESIYNLIVYYAQTITNIKDLGTGNLNQQQINELEQLLSIMRQISHARKEETTKYDLTINILATILQQYYWSKK